MFPRLRQRIGTTLLDRIDLALELSTLGAYGLGEDGRPLAIDYQPAASRSVAPAIARTRDRCDGQPMDRAESPCAVRARA